MFSIPKTIVQTGKQKSDINEHSIQWQKQNREFHYIFFDDEDCRKFIGAYCSQEVIFVFDILKPGVFKADLFRYCYLYTKGVIYLDLDCSLIVPFGYCMVCRVSDLTVRFAKL